MVLDLLKRRRSNTELDTHFIYYLGCYTPKRVCTGFYIKGFSGQTPPMLYLVLLSQNEKTYFNKIKGQMKQYFSINLNTVSVKHTNFCTIIILL